MPVYLRMTNPLVIDFEGGKYGRSDAIEMAKRDGHDAAILRNHYDAGGVQDQYVVFKPEQIKSAIGNNGAFDPNSPDIRFNSAESLPSTKSTGKILTDEQSQSDIARLARGLDAYFRKNGERQTVPAGGFSAVQLPDHQNLAAIAGAFGKRVVGIRVNPKHTEPLGFFRAFPSIRRDGSHVYQSVELTIRFVLDFNWNRRVSFGLGTLLDEWALLALCFPTNLDLIWPYLAGKRT